MSRLLFVSAFLAILTIAPSAHARRDYDDFNDRYYRHEIKEHGYGHPRNCDHNHGYNRGGYYSESYTTWEPSYTRTYNNYVEPAYYPPAYYPPVYNVFPQPRTVYHYPVQRPNVVFQLGF